MGALRIVIVVLLTATISSALTGWLVNIGHTNSRHQGYPAPSLAVAPVGDMAGAARAPPVTDVANPLAGDAAAIAEGHKLFLSMNCAGCHGYDASGGMGPNLTDSYWRYGGTPQRIYQSIRDGRPKGMPAWGVTLPPKSIWELVSYVQSLGGAVPANLAQAAAEGNLDRDQNKGASDQQ